MQKNRVYKIASLFILFFMLSGCSLTKNQKILEKSQKTLTVKSKNIYRENESIQFEINTGKSEGYLSLVYLDKQGNTNVLYSNKSIVMNRSLEDKDRVTSFPKDFGDKSIFASKNCKNCEKEKTEILVIFSDDPLPDIGSMNKSDLLRLNSKTVVQKVKFLVK